jgi:hypothetical protein
MKFIPYLLLVVAMLSSGGCGTYVAVQHIKEDAADAKKQR